MCSNKVLRLLELHVAEVLRNDTVWGIKLIEHFVIWHYIKI